MGDGNGGLCAHYHRLGGHTAAPEYGDFALLYGDGLAKVRVVNVGNADGSHDDHVMGLAIAYHIRTQQDYTPSTMPNVVKFKWTEDMLEDYYNGTDEVKKLMESQYGLPN